MDIKELRIGNYIYDDLKQIRQLFGLRHNSLSSMVEFTSTNLSCAPRDRDLMCSIKQCSPIILNKDNIGHIFKNAHILRFDMNYFEFENIKLSSLLNDGDYLVEFKDEDKFYTKYLHIIQNRYFMIYGEELELKLPNVIEND